MLERIAGCSPAIAALKKELPGLAGGSFHLLIVGEKGTGKEFWARVVHECGPRRAGPFVKVRCRELYGEPPEKLEARLRGSRGGTVFLEEVGELPLPAQGRLARFLQEVPRKVRFVAASTADPEKMVGYGRLRRDVYGALAGRIIWLPPLRERKEDIPLLVEAFLQEFAAGKKPVAGVDPRVLALFARYPWPGNVRELRECVGAACLFAGSRGVIGLAHLPAYLLGWEGEPSFARELAQKVGEALKGRKALGEIMEEVERVLVARALAESGGNKARAAQLLGISRPGLYKKLMKYSLTFTG